VARIRQLGGRIDEALIRLGAGVAPGDVLNAAQPASGHSEAKR
jgi:hypothetical protein